MHSIFPNSILVNPASTKKPNLDELFLNNGFVKEKQLITDMVAEHC